MPAPPTARDLALRAFDAAVAAAVPQPVGVVQGGVARAGDAAVPVAGLARVLVVGAGKSAAALFDAVVPGLRDALPRAVRIDAELLVPAGAPPPHAVPDVACRVRAVRPPDVNESTAEARAATREVLDAARALGPDALLVCLLSGGGSATLSLPWPGLDAAAEHEAVRRLAARGASIDALNTLRRHCSAVKGGRLAQAAAGARGVLSFLVSDVDGDLPHVIASGPTVPDPTTFADALALAADLPAAVCEHLARGVRGELPETPKQLPGNVGHAILRRPRDALVAACDALAGAGRTVAVRARPVPGGFDEVVRVHVNAVRALAPGTAFVSVGEAAPPRPVDAPRGGRAGHLALAVALACEGDPARRGRVTVLVGATDGEDGTSGTSGGLVDAHVLARCRAAGVDPHDALRRCASLDALVAAGGTLPRRATGVNVQDLRVLIVD